jgi:hypothetical protein
MPAMAVWASEFGFWRFVGLGMGSMFGLFLLDMAPDLAKEVADFWRVPDAPGK